MKLFTNILYRILLRSLKSSKKPLVSWSLYPSQPWRWYLDQLGNQQLGTPSKLYHALLRSLNSSQKPPVSWRLYLGQSRRWYLDRHGNQQLGTPSKLYHGLLRSLKSSKKPLVSWRLDLDRLWNQQLGSISKLYHALLRSLNSSKKPLVSWSLYLGPPWRLYLGQPWSLYLRTASKLYHALLRSLEASKKPPVSWSLYLGKSRRWYLDRLWNQQLGSISKLYYALLRSLKASKKPLVSWSLYPSQPWRWYLDRLGNQQLGTPSKLYHALLRSLNPSKKPLVSWSLYLGQPWRLCLRTASKLYHALLRSLNSSKKPPVSWRLYLGQSRRWYLDRLGNQQLGSPSKLYHALLRSLNPSKKPPVSWSLYLGQPWRLYLRTASKLYHALLRSLKASKKPPVSWSLYLGQTWSWYLDRLGNQQLGSPSKLYHALLRSLNPSKKPPVSWSLYLGQSRRWYLDRHGNQQLGTPSKLYHALLRSLKASKKPLVSWSLYLGQPWRLDLDRLWNQQLGSISKLYHALLRSLNSSKKTLVSWSLYLGPPWRLYLGQPWSLYLRTASKLYHALLRSLKASKKPPVSWSLYLGQTWSLYLDRLWNQQLGSISKLYHALLRSLEASKKPPVSWRLYLGPPWRLDLDRLWNQQLGSISKLYHALLRSLKASKKTLVSWRLYLGPPWRLYLGPPWRLYLGPPWRLYLGQPWSLFLRTASKLYHALLRSLNPSKKPLLSWSLYLGPPWSLYLGPHWSLDLDRLGNQQLGTPSKLYHALLRSLKSSKKPLVSWRLYLGQPWSLFLRTASRLYHALLRSLKASKKTLVSWRLYLGQPWRLYLGQPWRLYLGLLVILGNHQARAQTYPVTASIIPTHQNLSPYLHEWINSYTLVDPMQISLLFNDLNNAPINGVIRVEISGPHAAISSNPSTPTIISLIPGDLMILDHTMLTHLFSPNRLSSGQNLGTQSPLPAGLYQICIEVFDIIRNVAISNRACNLFRIQQFDVPEWRMLQPITTLPSEEFTLGTLDATLANTLTFNWSPRHPAIFMAEYTLEIFASPLDHQLTPEQIVQSQPPIHRITTFGTNYFYTQEDPILEANRTYLARLKVRDPNDVYQFVNNGIGPIGTFQLKDLGAGSSTLCGDPENQPSLVLNNLADQFAEVAWTLSDPFGNGSVFVFTQEAGADWRQVSTLPAARKTLQLDLGVSRPKHVRIGVPCGEDQAILFSNSISLVPFPDILPDGCTGLAPNEWLSHTLLESEIIAGDSIMVGDFILVFEEVTRDGDGYHGFGYVTTPLFNQVRPKISVEVTGLLVNHDFRMIGGTVQTIYDEEDAAMLSVGDLGAVFNKLGALDDLAYEPITRSDTIVGIHINTAGETELLVIQNGDTVVVTYRISSEEPDPLLLEFQRGAYTIAGDAFVNSSHSKPTTFIGADGKTYGQVGQSVYVESDRLLQGNLQMMGDKGRVFFENHPDAVGGFDDPFAAALPGDYVTIGEDYSMSWKAIRLGSSDSVTVHLSDVRSEVDSLFFETVSGFSLGYPDNTDDITLHIPGRSESDREGVYALGKSEGENQLHTLGGLKIAAYPLRMMTLQVVALNKADIPITEEALASDLNRIFNPAIVSWRVKFLDPQDIEFDLDGDGQLDASKGFTGQFGAELKAVARGLKDVMEQGTKDLPVLTIAVVPNLKGSYEGYMPRGRNLGFVQTVDDGKTRDGIFKFSRIVAHELGHGAFALKHSWEEYPGLDSATSNNLMDYTDGIHLTKGQWDQIHQPRPVLGFLETGEGSGSVAVNTKGKAIGDFFQSLVTDDLFIPFLTPGHTRIILPKSATDPIFFHGIESDLYSKIYTGSLIGFSLDGLRYHAQISDQGFHGYFASDLRYTSTVPKNAGTRSKELITILYPCGSSLFAESFEAPEIAPYAEGQINLIDEPASPLRLFENQRRFESLEYEEIEGLFTGSQSAVSEIEVKMTESHCGKPTIPIVSKIAQVRNRYPTLFHRFSSSFDDFFEAIETVKNSNWDPMLVATLGVFEDQMLRDNTFFDKVEKLSSSDPYQFYILFLEELASFIKEHADEKEACLTNLDQIAALELAECINTFSNDEVEDIDAITKFLMIQKLIDAPITPNKFEKEINRLIKHVKNGDQADELYVLIRNDLASEKQNSFIYRLFFAVDDAFLFGSEDLQDLVLNLTRLCAGSRSFQDQANDQANSDDVAQFSFIFDYQSIWQDIHEAQSTYPVFHIESDGSLNSDGSISIDQNLEKGFTELVKIGQWSFHALQPIFFVDKSKLTMLSDYDDVGQIVPAIVAQYAVRKGNAKTTTDIAEAGIDILSVGSGAAALKLGISGLRKAIILADMFSAGLTLSLNTTDADQHLHQDALQLLRSAALISGLFGAADVINVSAISEAFSFGRQAAKNQGVLDDFNKLKTEAENLTDQIISQTDMNRYAEIGSERLQAMVYECEKLITSSQAAREARLTIKLRTAKGKLLRLINDVDHLDDYADLLKIRYPILSQANHADLLANLVVRLQENQALVGLSKLGDPLHTAAKGLTKEKQLLLFKYIADTKPFSEILTTHPHLLRFEPWSWPTGPPSLLTGLEALRKSDMVIFDKLFKEGGQLVIRLDLSGDVTANALKVQGFCDDIVKENALFEYFGRDGRGVRAWDDFYLAKKTFSQTNPRVLEKYLRLSDRNKEHVIRFSDDPKGSSLSKFLDEVDEDFVVLLNDNPKYLEGFTSHKGEPKWTIDQYVELSEEILENPNLLAGQRNKITEWLDRSSDLTKFGRVTQKGIDFNKNVVSTLSSRSGKLFNDLAAHLKIGPNILKQYEVYTEVPLKTEGGFMKADVVFVKRGEFGFEDIIVVENKLSAGTNYTVRQKEGWKKLANGESLDVKSIATGSDPFGNDVLLQTTDSFSANKVRTVKISDHGETAISNSDISTIPVNNWKNYVYTPN